jgi:hypothetical protein
MVAGPRYRSAVYVGVSQRNTMDTDTVKYNAKTSGLEIDEISVDSPNPKITSIVCTVTKDGEIEVSVKLKDVYCEDWPVQEIVQEVQQFIDVLSFEFNCPIHSLRETNYALMKKDGSDISQVISTNVGVWDSVSTLLKPGDESLDRLKQRYLNFRQSSSLRLYSSAIQQKDPIARFMFLYNIILTLSDEKQVQVDSNIRSVAPDTPETKSPRNQNIQETVYTRLRNEIAHNRVGADFNTTSEEVSQFVSKLENITRQLVMNSG